ncbi:hypothetical protein Pelo_9425 [Pelomyxa schiedti]|nr:hypothetical protein Pelo_9425 [Pelomyxa schiedti]
MTPREQVTELCKSGVIPHVVKCLSSPKGDACIREEACWVIANCIETNHPEVIQYMISLGILTPLVKLLVSEDRPTTLILVLEALQRILATDRGSPNKLWASYDSLAESVSDLQSHQCTTVVSLATRLLEKYDPEKVVEDAGSYDGAERMDTE